MTPSSVYSLLSDETRLRCLMLLHKRGKLCVCELMHALSSTQPKISRHLSLLRNYGIVTDERKGQWVYYSLNTSVPSWMHTIIQSNFEALAGMEPYRSDLARVFSLQKEDACLG